eukprot:3941135-Rhodomonas_salina.2
MISDFGLCCGRPGELQPELPSPGGSSGCLRVRSPVEPQAQAASASGWKPSPPLVPCQSETSERLGDAQGVELHRADTQTLELTDKERQALVQGMQGERAVTEDSRSQAAAQLAGTVQRFRGRKFRGSCGDRASY